MAHNKKQSQLHGTVKKYEKPTEPVGESDWDLLKDKSKLEKERATVLVMLIRKLHNYWDAFFGK